MSEYLTKEAILAAQDHVVEPVEVPEWGGKVLVKGLTGSERDAYEASILRMRKDGQMIPNLAHARAKLIVAALVDGKGGGVFSQEDILALGAKSARAMQRVFDKARELSGLSNEDMEELLGNSEIGQSEGSTSG